MTINIKNFIIKKTLEEEAKLSKTISQITYIGNTFKVPLNRPAFLYIRYYCST